MPQRNRVLASKRLGGFSTLSFAVVGIRFLPGAHFLFHVGGRHCPRTIAKSESALTA